MTVSLPPDMPDRMKRLPTDSVGRPVPKFVAEVDGTYDFRIADGAWVVTAYKERLCWVCGNRLAANPLGKISGVFVVGPMCVVNRTSSELPSHKDCAEWSAKACPFLTNPNKGRRTGNLPDDARDPGGIFITRNPGVMALVHSDLWKPQTVDGGVLFRFGVNKVDWWCEGRAATYDEVVNAIETGLPALVEMAAEEKGADVALARMLRAALRHLPEPNYPPVIAAALEGDAKFRRDAAR